MGFHKKGDQRQFIMQYNSTLWPPEGNTEAKLSNKKHDELNVETTESVFVMSLVYTHNPEKTGNERNKLLTGSKRAEQVWQIYAWKSKFLSSCLSFFR